MQPNTHVLMSEAIRPDAGDAGTRPWLRMGIGLVLTLLVGPALAAITCERNVTADIVAFDMPLMFNRLGASNVNGAMYALRRDVIDTSSADPKSRKPLTAGGYATPGQVELRPDIRPRPLVLRVRVGDCLTVKLENLLTPAPNPFNAPLVNAAGQQFTVHVDEQIASRVVGFEASGMMPVESIDDMGSMVGRNHHSGGPGSSRSATGAQAAPGETRTYKLYADKEGVHVVTAGGASVGNDSNQGHSGTGLFGQVIVEPKGARIYRGQLVEEEMRLATVGTVATGQPKLNYEATYPSSGAWVAEGKAGLPIVNMMKCSDETNCEIVHAEINAVIAGPEPDGSFPPSTYPLESVGKRNPTVPNRLQAFRDFASIWHDEPATAQAFPGFFVDDPVFSYVLAGVKDGFMINYGSGGIGSEIIANRLGVGPMHDCLSCAYEEFFLTSFTVGDPALIVDVPANVGLEALMPGEAPPAGAVGRKANYVIGANDPSNVHMSYIGDFVKFRNTHIGKEQHVFHLHNHQWLYNPNDDNSNYLDAQGLGPGSAYTYEINFGGSGNRNKSAGDAIFHCHFYPHFAQGMWYHWRHLDTYETGTKLAASGDEVNGYHTEMWGLANTTPAIGARAYPDGEIERGVPIPAVVPLPGKALPVMPGQVTVVAKLGAQGQVLGSNAKVIDRDKNPGYPFWIAGIEDVVGQRPPTPVLDMLTPEKAAELVDRGGDLWKDLKPAQAAGFDGGLPRHALQGYADGGVSMATVNNLDFSKTLEAAKPVYFPEEGTVLEKVAMAFHAQREHASFIPDMKGVNESPAPFVTNGARPAIGGAYHDPCIDDRGKRLAAGVLGDFFSGETPTGMSTRGRSQFNGDTPRIYKGANIQFDAILNKVGYHFPQQRIVALWEDAGPVIAKQQPPEPLVMRLNTFDCAVFHHTNLVPEYYELDDYQVRTPTDIIGQHIHLPKWDLTTTDGAANGWNYEDGTLSPGAVRERIHAIRHFNHCVGTDSGDPRDGTGECPVAKEHPYFGSVAKSLGGRFPEVWKGARTTMQRWFADPVVNALGVDRGLGIIFTHDHYGPSSHQQVGLYATVLVQPAGSTWVHNETGDGLGCKDAVNTSQPAGTTSPNTAPCRWDGGPVSWQAAILPPATAPLGSTVKSETVPAHREFYFEYSDFQHAYEAGVYVGADERGLPTPAAIVVDPANPSRATAPALAETFRRAINPPARQQITPLFPDITYEVASGIIPGCPTRPCPQAISVEDPGMLVVNYRNEPVALRVFDPNKAGPDGKPGAQADGLAGDLAYALASRVIDKLGNEVPLQRKIAELNKTEAQLGFWGKTLNASTAVDGGDPFTPMMRSYSGDLVRMKIQAGGHEEEHNSTIHGVKWLQAGSGFGRAPNSGWRNGQAAGISEQFTFTAPLYAAAQQVKNGGVRDHAYAVDTSMDGWWSGMWGLIRTYDAKRDDLFMLPNDSFRKNPNIVNRAEFEGVCPADVTVSPRRNYGVVAILANELLAKPSGVSIAWGNSTQHAGAAVNPDGGTLVYNPRTSAIPQATIPGEGGEPDLVLGGHAGPIHDPTAILYARIEDLVPVNPKAGACKDSKGGPGVANPSCPVRLKDGQKVEPLILRAAAGECVQVTLYNRLPQVAPDLPTVGTLLGVVKRDRNRPEGSVPFDNNLIRPSSHVGLHTQLLAMDVTQDDGANVGGNIVQTVSPVDPATGKAGKTQTYRWYAGDVSARPESNGVRLFATPVEFGGVGLIPADKVKQGQKSMVGALIVLPKGATWKEDDNQYAHATVWANGTEYRDFALVMTKNLNHRYADGFPVEHMNGEGLGMPEDSQENSSMAFNYGVEPLWFRLGVPPNAPFGGAGCGPGCYGGVPNAHQAYSNVLTDGNDPVTPVFTAKAGQEVRIHIAVPHSTSRGSTIAIQGHKWQRDPYVCKGEAAYGLTGKCTVMDHGGLLDGAGKPLVGSRDIGDNPVALMQNAQDSMQGYTHFTFRLPRAGGENGVKGDYLFRDKGSFGNASGLWGILRVTE